jgi:hypothetical protein
MAELLDADAATFDGGVNAKFVKSTVATLDGAEGWYRPVSASVPVGTDLMRKSTR